MISIRNFLMVCGEFLLGSYRIRLLALLLAAAVVSAANYAIRFNGTSSQVLFPASFPALGSVFTVECFYRCTGIEPGASDYPWEAILERQEWGVQEWGLIINGDSTDESGGSVSAGYTYDGDHNTAHYIGSKKTTFNQWHHCALVGTGSSILFFCDGLRINSQTQTGPLGATPSVKPSAGSLMNPYEFFKGDIDEIRISSSARYLDSTYLLPSAEFTDDSNTLGLWHFNEGTGLSTADASGSGYSGTLTGNPVWTTGYPFSGVGVRNAAVAPNRASGIPDNRNLVYYDLRGRRTTLQLSVTGKTLQPIAGVFLGFSDVSHDGRCKRVAVIR